MYFKNLVLHFLVTGAVVFMMSSIVIYIVNLVRSGTGLVDWLIALFIALVLGLYFTLLEARRR